MLDASILPLTLRRPLASTVGARIDVIDLTAHAPGHDRWQAMPDGDPTAFFQTARWAGIAAGYERSHGRRVVLLEIRDGGRSFVLPLALGRESGAMVARIVGEVMSEFSTGVGEGPSATALAAGLARLQADCRVDAVELRRVPQGSALHGAMLELGAQVLEEHQSCAVLLDRDGARPRSDGRLPTGIRDARRMRRKLAQRGYTFEVVEPGPRAAAIMRQAIAWKFEWVRQRGLVSRIGTDPHLTDAFADLFADPRAGALAGAVSIDGELAAVEGVFAAGDTCYATIGGRRPDLEALKVGKVVMVETVEWAAARGFRSYDLGPPAIPYKLDWCTEVHSVSDLVLPLSARGALHVFAAGSLKPLARRAFGALPPAARNWILGFTRYSTKR